jgi:ribosomal protein L9
MINLPLDYKINDNNLVIDAKDLNMQKHLFIEIKNNNIATITHKEANLKIDKSNIKDNQIILDIGNLNIDKNLKIHYSFKKSIISYILKKNVFN